jgi:hypothetical protein
MFILASIAALSFFEILFFTAFILLLCVSTLYDRKGKYMPFKWGVFGVGILIYLVFSYFNKDKLTNSEFFAGIFSNTIGMWKEFAIYLAIGLGYSVIEFIVQTRTVAREYADSWESHTSNNQVLKDHLASPVTVPVAAEKDILLMDGERQSSQEAEKVYQDAVMKYNAVTTEISRFVARVDKYGELIAVKASADGLSVEPFVRKKVLVEYVSAWTVLWPFYALSLIFGNLLTEIVTVLVDITTKFSGAFVRLTFKNVFK